MNWTDEVLGAYADGELDETQRARVAQAMIEEPGLRERVDALQRQRARLAAAFAASLDEPVPDRLTALLRQAPGATVTTLAQGRRARGPSWALWGGMAAALLVGVLLGTQLGPVAPTGTLALQDGRLVASGEIAHALSSALASEPQAGAPVSVQLSFVDKAGDVCRTFSTDAIAGLACRQAGRWAVQAVAAAAPTPAGPVRQAASGLPRAVLDAVDARIDGEAMDAARERAARDRGWRR